MLMEVIEVATGWVCDRLRFRKEVAVQWYADVEND